MFRTAVFALVVAAGCRAVPAPPPPPAETVKAPEPSTERRQVRQRVKDLAKRMEDLKREAHEALDQGRYDEAATLHRHSLEIARKLEEAQASEEVLVRAEARRLIDDLDAEEISVREGATRGLIELGAGPALIREMSKHLTGEAARRVELILARLEKGYNGRQWASGAKASSEFTATNWSAFQATGEPNTPGAGDHATAWASRDPDGGAEWLELTFEIPVEPTLVRVHETYNAGAITKIEAKDGTGEWRTVWDGAAATVETPRWLEVAVPAGGWTTREIRVTLDSTTVTGWNEIDAVELVGLPPGGALR